MWEKIEKYGRIEGTEGYPSGRRGLIANELVWGNLERGFKSLTLRQTYIVKQNTCLFYFFKLAHEA